MWKNKKELNKLRRFNFSLKSNRLSRFGKYSIISVPTCVSSRDFHYLNVNLSVDENIERYFEGHKVFDVGSQEAMWGGKGSNAYPKRKVDPMKVALVRECDPFNSLGFGDLEAQRGAKPRLLSYKPMCN